MTKLVKIQLAIAVPLVLVGGFFAFYIYHQLTTNLGETKKNNVQSNENIYDHRLDGTKINLENSDLFIAGVMIENHVDARPQSGLSRARIVYEILAESDITRFLAIFDLADNLEQIGPVRSARPYYIDIASEYGAIYAHSGGSNAALNRLKYDKFVTNLDEFFGYNTAYFWRDINRYAPHNLYTSTNLLMEAKDHYNVSSDADFRSWKFKDGQPNSESNTEIKIDYSGAPSYQVIWKYIKDTNRYERWQNKTRHVDIDGSVVEADNVIIQYATMKILDEVGRKDIKLIGSGECLIFRDGLNIEGTWQKKDAASRTIFYDQNDNEIELNRGKIWIEVVSKGIEVVY